MDRTNVIKNRKDQGKDPLLIDLNILPERYRRKKITPLMVLPWVLWIASIGLVYPMIMNLIQAQATFQEAKTEFLTTQATVESYQPLAAELDALQAQIDEANQAVEDIKSSYQGINIESQQWSEILTLIKDNTPQGTEITNVVQNGDQIVVEGYAKSYQMVLDMDGLLKNVGCFSKIELQAINRVVSKQPTPTPSEAGEESLFVPTPSFVYSFRFSIDIKQEVTQP